MKKDLYDNRYWLVVIGLLTMFFIFLAWIAYPESFWLLISLMIIVSVVLTAVPLLLNRRQKDRLDAAYRSFLIEPDMEKEAELRALVPKSEVDRLRMLGDLLREKADELNRQDLQIRDYQTYIEEWVHEIKKPISLMSLVLDNRDDEMSTLVHLRMTRARNDIQSDVEKILYFARLSTAHRDYLFQPMSLVKVCQEAIVDHQSLLDEAGFEDAIISASSDLDEFLIRDLKLQGSKISLWGVGTKLITAQDNPSFGGVYKLAAEETEGGKLKAKIKLSDNPAKVTNPGYKKVLRIYDKATGMMKADLIALEDEVYNENEELTIFDPNNTWKRMTFKPGTYTLREMLVPIFIDGKCVYNSPNVNQIRDYCKTEVEKLWPESRRLVNAQTIPVDLSQRLYDLKQEMLLQYGKER